MHGARVEDRQVRHETVLVSENGGRRGSVPSVVRSHATSFSPPIDVSAQWRSLFSQSPMRGSTRFARGDEVEHVAHHEVHRRSLADPEGGKDRPQIVLLFPR